MKIAGYWRRYWANFINQLMIGVTLGIYLIIMIVKFFKGQPNIGQRAAGIEYSNPDRQGKLLGFSILNLLVNLTGIGLIINFFRVCLKKGTFAEKWADNYLIIVK